MSLKSVVEMVMHYREMEAVVPQSGMLREARWQYAAMAEGGDGGDTGAGGTIRKVYYPGLPDSFFQEVCDLLGWPR